MRKIKKRAVIKPPNINIIASLKKYLLPNLPYIGVGWFANKISEAYHLSQDYRAAYRIIETLPNLSTAMSNPAPSIYSTDLIIGLLGAFLFFGVVWHKKRTAKKWRHDVEYGSARWGLPVDIAPYVADNPDDNIILTATESLTLNSRPKQPKYARNKNVLVIGGSGSGKTRFFVKPNIMQCISKSFPVSLVCTDPKGGLVYECASLLKRKGYKIKILNTIDFDSSLKYNPFPLL